LETESPSSDRAEDCEVEKRRMKKAIRTLHAINLIEREQDRIRPRSVRDRTPIAESASEYRNRLWLSTAARPATSDRATGSFVVVRQRCRLNRSEGESKSALQNRAADDSGHTEQKDSLVLFLIFVVYLWRFAMRSRGSHGKSRRLQAISSRALPSTCYTVVATG
jgi:hypothetical protein